MSACPFQTVDNQKQRQNLEKSQKKKYCKIRIKITLNF